MSEGEYIPTEDVFQNIETREIVPKNAEGKITKVASKGVPMSMAKARELGIVGGESGEASTAEPKPGADDPESAYASTEAKAVDAPAENKAVSSADNKTTSKTRKSAKK